MQPLPKWCLGHDFCKRVSLCRSPLALNLIFLERNYRAIAVDMRTYARLSRGVLLCLSLDAPPARWQRYRGNSNRIGPNDRSTTSPDPLATFRWTFRSILIRHPIPIICGKGKSAVLKAQMVVLTLVTSGPMALFNPLHTALRSERKSLRASLNSISRLFARI
jgi:hypothetical protein